MIISKYGVCLRRLSYEDIDLVRRMRNRSDIRKKMWYRKPITPEEQGVWFKSVDNQHNFYFVVEYCGEKMGVVSASNLDYRARVVEGGAFFWHKEAFAQMVTVKSIVVILEIMFSIFDIQKINSRVNVDNHQAFQNNLALGYQLVRSELQHHMVLSRERFAERVEKLRFLCSRGRDLSGVTEKDIIFSSNDASFLQSLPSDIQGQLQVDSDVF